ncbi:hypothetical protein AVEN_254105-1 [Araneus ventricosus]|uniref:BHLH domain-containing protein n=1 Tax=Araneus ventricosus TaxID=182803 RepID=A0A4Y2BZ22_ARAVE|nr:hypothetical protein AVEN_254105-1 [Araneus ventricosus]
MEKKSAGFHNTNQLNFRSVCDCDNVSEKPPTNFNKRRKVSFSKINPFTNLESLNKTENLQEHDNCIKNSPKLKEKKNSVRKFSRRRNLSYKERKSKRLMSNERERERNRYLTDAFKSLQRVIPYEERLRELSKIETLIFAKNYIKSLTNTILRMNGLPIFYHLPAQDEEKSICLTKAIKCITSANKISKLNAQS